MSVLLLLLLPFRIDQTNRAERSVGGLLNNKKKKKEKGQRETREQEKRDKTGEADSMKRVDRFARRGADESFYGGKMPHLCNK